MTIVSARSNLVNFSPEKNLASNRPKPIRVLTVTKSSCSDERQPIGFLFPDFQQLGKTFLTSLPLFFFTVNFTGVDPYGGASLPLECRRPGRKGVDTGKNPCP